MMKSIGITSFSNSRTISFSFKLIHTLRYQTLQIFLPGPVIPRDVDIAVKSFGFECGANLKPFGICIPCKVLRIIYVPIILLID
ncbi:MAG: hypothetical protein M3Z01_05300 [Thermoproteota archaeon]|nr:hypothetical protein [Thermoproteota archaeon]